MDDEAITTFCSITDTTPQQAQQYLQFSDGNVEQAIELFFNNPDLAGSAPAAQPQPASTRDDPINLDDDDDDVADMSAAQGGPSTEDDEAMARRLQEEMYGAGGGGGAGGAGGVDEEGVRAPMARTTETLVGPGSDWRDDPNEMQAAIGEQMQARMRHREAQRAGIFNQRNEASIWSEDNPEDPDAHRRVLSRATGGASDATSKSNLLAELFRPPFDLISPIPISTARDEGKESEKWILVNVQDPSIFDCQVLNRDIWKNDSIKETVKEHFIFLQYNKEDPRAGEQVKTWSGSPGPKPSDFLMDLHEFLDRYSLSMHSKNPVQTQRKERKKDVGQMSEEEMLEMAMKNSLANGGDKEREEDPDALTKATEGKGKGRASVPEAMDTEDMGPAPSNGSTALAASEDTPFSRISSTSPHEEPASTDPKETTRIQFRYSGGRIVRRFLLSDPVTRIYEWLKAAPFEGKENKPFELIAMGKNLMEMLDVPIADAGLKNGTVMVEFIDDE